VPKKVLYRTPIPFSSLSRTGSNTQRELESLVGLGGTAPTVETVGSQAGRFDLRGAYKLRYAEMLGRELRELLDADALDTLEFYTVDETPPDQGYYAADRVDGGRVRPQTDLAARFDGELVREGTRASHRRAVQAGPPDARQVDHDFGSEQTAALAVPAAAERIQWLDGDRTARTTATPDRTVAAEFGDLHLFDLQTAPTGYQTRPYLVYQLPFTAAGDVDTKVWDTYGREKIDDDGVVAWQRVFKSEHEIRGALVVETGRIRTTLDPAADPGVTAQRWDADTGSWTGVALESSDWTLADIDLVRPGAAHVRAQLTFRDTASTALYPLDAVWHRGYDTVQFAIPESESGPIPSGLIDLLASIAEPSVLSPQSERTLIARSDLRA
jgi:hypothetical protein